MHKNLMYSLYYIATNWFKVITLIHRKSHIVENLLA